MEALMLVPFARDSLSLTRQSALILAVEMLLTILFSFCRDLVTLLEPLLSIKLSGKLKNSIVMSKFMTKNLTMILLVFPLTSLEKTNWEDKGKLTQI